MDALERRDTPGVPLEHADLPRPKGRVLAVSHASVLRVNQLVYERLRDRGWDLRVVVPARWRHEYAADAFTPEALPGLERSLVRMRTALSGRPQRHFYLARLARLLRAYKPDVVLLEEESFSVPALQWGLAAARASVPFGVQAAENLDRPLPVVARAIRTWVLRHAAFVTARSPAAAELSRRWGALGEVLLVPHAVPDWQPSPRPAGAPFTVGFAGRLVEEKGVWDLVSAVRMLEGPIRLLLVGDGPLGAALESAGLPDGRLEIRRDVGHEGMAGAYAEMDVLVLPSRSSPRWTEQFGRVLVEALQCGVPVVGSDSGEIPWVVSATAGGEVFPEGDTKALASILSRLRAEPERRARLADRGRASAQRLFGLEATVDALETALMVTRRPVGAERAGPSGGADRPRIAIVAHGIHDHGGMERAFFELIRRGAGRFRFVVLSTELDPALRDLVEWKRIPAAPRPIPLKFLLFFVMAGARLARLRVDLVHSCGALVPNRVDLASVHLCHAAFREAVASTTTSAASPLRRINSRIARVLGFAAERWTFSRGRARMAAAVSLGVERELGRHYATLPVTVTPNGVDATRFRPDRDSRRRVRADERVSDSAVVAVFLGGDWDTKGLATTLEGLAEARRLGAEGIELWVIGRGDEPRYGEIARRLGLGQHVRFLGFRADPERFLAAADIFVLPSLYESFCLAAYEAAACGLPVVATRVGGIDELVGRDEGGIVVDRVPDAVGAALARLATDPALRARMGQAARSRAERSTWEKSFEAVAGCYERLLSEAPAFVEVAA